MASSPSTACSLSRRDAILLLGAGLAAPAGADEKPFPTRPIKLVSAFSPGGGTDTVSRLIAYQMSQLLGRSVIVENRPGADGAIGTHFVAKAAPDGYTLLMANFGTLAVLPHLTKQLYEPLRDFSAVSQTTSSATILVVSPSLKVNTVEELVNYAMNNPNRLNYGYSSSSPMIVAELFKQLAGIKMQPIPYKGTGPALTAILSGEIDVMFGGALNTFPYVKRGALRALATAGENRSPQLPNLPTVAEAGVRDFVAETWNGVVAPKGTPPNIVRRLYEVIQAALQAPEIKRAIETEGAIVSSSTPQQFQSYIESEYVRWGKIADSAGIRS